MGAERRRLGEILIEAGVLTREQLDQALEIQGADGRRLGSILLAYGFVPEPQLVQALSRQLSIPWVSLWHVDVPDELLDLVPLEVATECWVVPVYVRTERRGVSHLYIAMDDPTRDDVLQLVSQTAGLPVKAMVAGPSDIAAAIKEFYGVEVGLAPTAVALQTPAAARPASDLDADARLPQDEARVPPAAAEGERRRDIYDVPTLETDALEPAVLAPAEVSVLDVVEAGDEMADVVTLEEDLVVESDADVPAWQELVEDDDEAVVVQVVSSPEPLAAAPRPDARERLEPSEDEPAAAVAQADAVELPVDSAEVEVEAADEPDDVAEPASSDIEAPTGTSEASDERSAPGTSSELEQGEPAPGGVAALELPLRRSPSQVTRREQVRRLRAAALTFLDGTTIDLGGRPTPAGDERISSAAELVLLLRAAGQGETLPKPLPSVRWETYVADLIDLLVRKRVVTEDEILENLLK